MQKLTKKLPNLTRIYCSDVVVKLTNLKYIKEKPKYFEDNFSKLKINLKGTTLLDGEKKINLKSLNDENRFHIFVFSCPGCGLRKSYDENTIDIILHNEYGDEYDFYHNFEKDYLRMIMEEVKNIVNDSFYKKRMKPIASIINT